MGQMQAKMGPFLDRQTQKMLNRIGEGAVSFIKMELSVVGPPRSSGGEPPHFDSTRKKGKHLIDGIESQRPSDDSVRIISTGENSEALEFGRHLKAPRPFMAPAMEQTPAIIEKTLRELT